MPVTTVFSGHATATPPVTAPVEELGNIAFTYQYCDASRFYRMHTVVFANPTCLTPEVVTARLAAAPHLCDLTRLMGTAALLFDPTVLGLPEQYFEDASSEAELDWHEFLWVKPTAEAPTDPRPLPDFLAEVAAAPAFTFRSINALGVYGR